MPVIEAENKTDYMTLELLPVFCGCRGDDLVFLQDKPFALTRRGCRVRLESMASYDLGVYAETKGMEIWDEEVDE